MASIHSERTPNPNSLKFTTPAERFFHDDVVAISSHEEANRHRLGEQLFAIDGVDDVFITPEFVTVSKEPSANWNDVKGEIETVLAEYLGAQ